MFFQDKAMMDRWGFTGMRSFEHDRLAELEAPESTATKDTLPRPAPVEGQP